MLHYMTVAFGNASSIDHIYGDEAEKAVSLAANQVAELLGCAWKEIIFTSGATESINLAIQGSILGYKGKNQPRIAVTPVEHKAVLDTCTALAKKGLADIVNLRIDSQGRLDLEYLEKVCDRGISLLCVMAANNEIGNIYPIAAIGEIAQNYEIPFLCDASQAAGYRNRVSSPESLSNYETSRLRNPVSFFADSGMTMMAISAHKLYGPKGVGALVVKKGYRLEPILFGGGHQGGIRSGTLNVPGIVGLGEACRLRQLEMGEDEEKISGLRDKLQSLLLDKIPGLVINGDMGARLPGNLHISIPDIPNSAVIARIRSRLAISTGAACSSGVESPSHVLQALGLPPSVITGALRIGLGKFTTAAEIELAADILADAVAQVRRRINPMEDDV